MVLAAKGGTARGAQPGAVLLPLGAAGTRQAFGLGKDGKRRAGAGGRRLAESGLGCVAGPQLPSVPKGFAEPSEPGRILLPCHEHHPVRLGVPGAGAQPAAAPVVALASVLVAPRVPRGS